MIGIAVLVGGVETSAGAVGEVAVGGFGIGGDFKLRVLRHLLCINRRRGWLFG